MLNTIIRFVIVRGVQSLKFYAKNDEKHLIMDEAEIGFANPE